MRTFDPPTKIIDLWSVNVSDGSASAELWSHPLGWELRVPCRIAPLVLGSNGQLQRSQVYRQQRDAETDSQETRLRLEVYSRERRAPGSDRNL